MVNNNVYPVRVQNITEPWKEIYRSRIQHGYRVRNFIVIEPRVAADPLNITDVTSIDNSDASHEPELIYGGYYTKLIRSINSDEHVIDKEASVLCVRIACLKNNTSLKHAHMSTYIAMTDLLHHMDDFDMEPSHYCPDIIINTNTDISVAPLSSYSEMVREVTAAYINRYGVQPNIFVTFSDETLFTINTTDKKNKKK